MNINQLILIGGILHFGVLLAGALLPQVLNWKTALSTLDPLSRNIIWVHAAFVVLVIIGFGTVSVFLPDQLTNGTVLARSLCGFIAIFWSIRLAIQFFVFDATPYLTSRFLKTGYHGLTFVFTYHTIVYGWAALTSSAG